MILGMALLLMLGTAVSSAESPITDVMVDTQTLDGVTGLQLGFRVEGWGELREQAGSDRGDPLLSVLLRDREGRLVWSSQPWFSGAHRSRRLGPSSGPVRLSGPHHTVFVPHTAMLLDGGLCRCSLEVVMTSEDTPWSVSLGELPVDVYQPPVDWLWVLPRSVHLRKPLTPLSSDERSPFVRQLAEEIWDALRMKPRAYLGDQYVLDVVVRDDRQSLVRRSARGRESVHFYTRPEVYPVTVGDNVTVAIEEAERPLFARTFTRSETPYRYEAGENDVAGSPFRAVDLIVEQAHRPHIVDAELVWARVEGGIRIDVRVELDHMFGPVTELDDYLTVEPLLRTFAGDVVDLRADRTATPLQLGSDLQGHATLLLSDYDVHPELHTDHGWSLGFLLVADRFGSDVPIATWFSTSRPDAPAADPLTLQVASAEMGSDGRLNVRVQHKLSEGWRSVAARLTVAVDEEVLLPESGLDVSLSYSDTDQRHIDTRYDARFVPTLRREAVRGDSGILAFSIPAYAMRKPPGMTTLHTQIHLSNPPFAKLDRVLDIPFDMPILPVVDLEVRSVRLGPADCDDEELVRWTVRGFWGEQLGSSEPVPCARTVRWESVASFPYPNDLPLYVDVLVGDRVATKVIAEVGRSGFRQRDSRSPVKGVRGVLRRGTVVQPGS